MGVNDLGLCFRLPMLRINLDSMSIFGVPVLPPFYGIVGTGNEALFCG